MRMEKLIKNIDTYNKNGVKVEDTIITYLESQQEDIKEKLAQHDIEFNNPEKESDVIQDIEKITKIVIRYIALEPVDLYIYASGIHLKADEIYTCDNEFKTIINGIRTNIEWRNIYDSIQQDLRKFIRSFQEECKTYYEKYKKEKKIDLPKGVS